METYRIGRWTFDPDGCVLRAPGQDRMLEERAARTLALLCRRRGEVVGKDELVATIWHGRTVSPNSLAIVIGDLRRALDDEARTQILTVNKRGYRLAEAAPVAARRRPWLVPAGLAAALLLAGVAVHAQAPRALLVEPTRNDTGQSQYAPLAASLSSTVVDSAAHLEGFRVVQGGRRDLVLRSRLVIWGGGPELAITVIDPARDAVVWSDFAPGPPALLARHGDERLQAMGRKLRRRAFL